MSNSLIRDELESRLIAWADAQVPKIPIAFQAAPFKKPATPYVEAFLIPNDTVQYEVSGRRNTYMGLFQINCWAPSGNGMGAVEALSQSVIALFPVLPKVGAVSVERTPSAGKSILDPSGWVIVPVTVTYRMESL